MRGHVTIYRGYLYSHEFLLGRLQPVREGATDDGSGLTHYGIHLHEFTRLTYILCFY